MNAQEHFVLNLFFERDFKYTLQQRESFCYLDILSTSAHNTVERRWAGYNKVTVHRKQAAILTEQRQPGDKLCYMDSATIKSTAAVCTVGKILT